MPFPKRKYHKRGELIEGFEARKHPLYGTWHNMMVRCYRESDASFKDYGARGIKVDESWWHFANFVRDMGPKPSPDYTLERINNDEGYAKSNCRWATRSDQCLNRRVFKNSTTGRTGVHPRKNNGTFIAKFDYEGERYVIGYYDAFDQAVEARAEFVELFKRDREAAIQQATAEKIRLTSSTGYRGVTPCEGGYIVRTTVNGVRQYHGYFKTLEEAIDAKRRANKTGA